MDPEIVQIEKTKFLRALYIPALFVFIIWSVKLIEWISGQSFAYLGISPLKIYGLKGIALAPLIHANVKHLFNNTVPLLILGTVLFYFYKNIALRIWGLIYLLSGACVWLGGRDSYHIGASGIIYGLASFLFFSGIIRKNVTLIAISLLTVFLYGELIWGIFPIWPDISWESHLFGGLVGVVLSFVYRNEGPEKKEPEWIDDEEDSDPYWMESSDKTETSKDSDNR
jgi:membrane associated rhomboid family serine protease